MYELVIEKETAKDQFVKPIGVTRQQKWRKVMQFMSSNPSFLLDTLPSAPPLIKKKNENIIIQRLKKEKIFDLKATDDNQSS